jgi:hypothetical protein
MESTTNLAAISAAGNILQGLAAGKAQRDITRAQNSVLETQAAASNQVRGASNVRASAQASLSRFLQSKNNQRILDGAGRAQAGAQAALLRRKEATSGTNFDRRLQAAEALGAQAARAAFSGVSGGAADIMAGTQALQIARQEELAGRQASQEGFLLADQAAQLGRSGIDSLDNSRIFDQLDNRQDIAQVKPVTGNGLIDLLGQADNIAIVLGAVMPKKSQSLFSAEPSPLTLDPLAMAGNTIGANNAAGNAWGIQLNNPNR